MPKKITEDFAQISSLHFEQEYFEIWCLAIDQALGRKELENTLPRRFSKKNFCLV
jgi:hypothetical protein